jgi:hypothetical protein
MGYSLFLESEFFHFFNWHEQDPCDNCGLPVAKIFKPGAYEEHIDLEIHLNTDREITQAELALTREWVGSQDTLNVFAKDIIKSFIAFFTEAEDSPNVKDLVDSIWNLQGSKNLANALERAKKPPHLPSPEIDQALKAVLGKEEMAEIEFKHTSIQFSNVFRDGASYLLILWRERRKG